MFNYLKIGFIGAGNLAKAMIEGLVKDGNIQPEKIWVANRTPGKLLKLKDSFGINIAQTNEEVVDNADLVVIAVKPQDLDAAINSLSSAFTDKHIIVSLAAGKPLTQLRKLLPVGRLVRVMPNTPVVIGQGVVGYALADDTDDSVVPVLEDFLKPFGALIRVDEGDTLDALMVACSCGTGFVFELMTYWQDWIEERGFDPVTARLMTVKTFFGAAALAQLQPEVDISELQNRVASKKGVTAAGLDAMREFELERGLRLSFEKSWMRNKELEKQSK